MNLLYRLQQKFHAALAGLVAEPKPYLAMVKPAQGARFGDYQCNCAMSLAKELGQKPRDVAQEIVQRLDKGDELEPPEIAGPGFINLRFRSSWLAQQLQAMAGDDRLGIPPVSSPQTFVIDFSSPNVAKPMHVGHLRSTIIGDALARLLRFLGHQVVTDNHLGDWGTQFGMLLYGYKNFRDEEALQADPVAELVRLYVRVREMIKPAEADDEEETASQKYSEQHRQQALQIAEACRQETARLHAGDRENLRLWQMFQPWCQAEIDRIYQRLDIHFDQTLGESFYNPMLADVVQSLREHGIAQQSEGAVAIFFGENEPPALVQKKDGAFTYTTTDLATIRYRIEKWQPSAILYVVDFRQALHFKNLFDAARRWGFDKVRLEHISFGSVLGSDGKPIKTREGVKFKLPGDAISKLRIDDVPDEVTAKLRSLLEKEFTQEKDFILALGAYLSAEEMHRYRSRVLRHARGGSIGLDLLLNEAVERATEIVRENSPHLAAEKGDDVAEAVGIGAVKYADLSQNRESDYKFSWDKMLAMDGNTATYMQYAYVRNRGIFRKGNERTERFRTAPPLPTLDHANERSLGLQLLRFQEALEAAAADYRPNLITSYLWDLAKTYSGFFEKCHVLNAETDDLRTSRLLLCDLTARVIRQGLELLGIQTVEKM